MELKPFALKSFNNIDGTPLKYHNKINNTTIPIGPAFIRLCPSAKKLLLAFEDRTNPIKVTKITIAVNALAALPIVFQIFIIVFLCFAQLCHNGSFYSFTG